MSVELVKETVKEVKKVPVDTKTGLTKDQMIKRNKRDRDMNAEKVRGIFRFYECPGFELNFVYKAYEGDELERYDLIDGKIYTLPLGVAKHLNKNGWYPVHAFAKGEDGETNVKVTDKVRRFGFQSLEFVDIGEHDKQLVTAEFVR